MQILLRLRLLSLLSPSTSSLLLSVLFPTKAAQQPSSQLPLSPSALYQPPLVIWHGLGDSYDADGIQAVATLANETNPHTFVHAIRLGDDGSADRRATFFGNLTEQVQQVCDQLASHPILSLSPSINALGFSQGGQFLRAYVERCNKPPVRNLVTFGAQHNGISEFQSCASATDWVCQSANALLRAGTWSSLVQRGLVPAQYFRDPEEIEAYLEGSNFLADVNNERAGKRNTTYKSNLASLEKFVMYMFKEDETVVPKETSWFAEVNRTSEIVTLLKDRRIYQEDWLGLKKLDETGRLIFDEVPGKHMQIDDDDLERAFKKYFAPISAVSDESADRYNLDKELAQEL